MHRWRRNPSNILNNKGNEAAQEENRNFTYSKIKDIDICDLMTEFKIEVLKISGRYKKIQIGN